MSSWGKIGKVCVHADVTSGQTPDVMTPMLFRRHDIQEHHWHHFQVFARNEINTKYSPGRNCALEDELYGISSPVNSSPQTPKPLIPVEKFKNLYENCLTEICFCFQLEIEPIYRKIRLQSSLLKWLKKMKPLFTEGKDLLNEECDLSFKKVCSYFFFPE